MSKRSCIYLIFLVLTLSSCVPLGRSRIGETINVLLELHRVRDALGIYLDENNGIYPESLAEFVKVKGVKIKHIRIEELHYRGKELNRMKEMNGKIDKTIVIYTTAKRFYTSGLPVLWTNGNVENLGHPELSAALGFEIKPD